MTQLPGLYPSDPQHGLEPDSVEKRVFTPLNATEQAPDANMSAVQKEQETGVTIPLTKQTQKSIGTDSDTHVDCARPTRAHTEQSSNFSAKVSRSPMGSKRRIDAADNYIPNIVIFGEAGVGKSSIINLIAGKKCADVSNDALGCTFEYGMHVVEIDGMACALWDTTGLDEGTQGTVPAKIAEDNLKELIELLANSGGIHLVIYCIRGTRLTKALKRNYDLFYVTICRKKVPVALVVTGLEHEEGSMENWWNKNRAALQRCGMWFDAHACVTTLDIDDTVIQERRLHSERCLRTLLTEYAKRRPWKIEPSLISWASPMSLWGGSQVLEKRTVRRVVIFDREAPPGIRTRIMGNQQLEYEFVHVDTLLNRSMSSQSASLGAGVLVFFTAPFNLNNGVPPRDIVQLKKFYDTAGGKVCPLIMVFRDCDNEEVAWMCADAVASYYADIRPYYVVGEGALDLMIEKLCIEHVEVKHSSGLWRFFTSVVEFLWKQL